MNGERRDLLRRATLVALSSLTVSECYADTPRPGWTVTTAGCRVWNPRPQPDESVSWSGRCQNGYTQGKGTEQWYSAGKLSNRLEGDAHDGMMSRAKVSYPNGDYYDGDLAGVGRNGYGVYVSVTGSRYEGAWRDDKRNGRGALIFSNGERYDGEFRDGNRDGHGVYIWPSGNRFDGEWHDNKRNGHGILVTPTGDRYVGEWNNDKFSRPLYEILLQQENGVLMAPVIINGTIKIDFMIDSGASDVNIPADVALTLFRTKTLGEQDFLGKKTYMLADGSSVPSDSFRIRSLRIGDFELKDVAASVGSVASVPLLGQSFLRRLGRWSIDNQRSVLVLDGEAPTEKNNE
jgi:clan AA aspartic protease (TIGR02281 family)